MDLQDTARHMLPKPAQALAAAWAAHFVADRQRTERLVDTAIDAARHGGDVEVELSALVLQQLVLQRVSTPEEAAAALQGLLDRAQQLGLQRVVWLAQDALATNALVHGQPATALQLAAATADVPVAERGLSEVVHAELLRGVAACWAGQVEVGLQHGYRTLHVARQLGQGPPLATALSFLGDVQANRCANLQDALPLLQEADTLLRALPSAPTVLNNLVNCVDALQSHGLHDEARSMLQVSREAHGGSPAWMRRRPRLALLYVSAGMLEPAEECLADFVDDSPAEPFQAWEWRLATVLLHLARAEYRQALAMARMELAREIAVLRPARQLLRMHDAMRQCCEALQDADGAAAALLEVQRLLPPALRDAAHAQYLSLDLASAPLQPAAARPTDRRRLQAIDRRAQQPPVPASGAFGVPRFVAHVTHELMTPVSGFVWLSESLLRSSLDERQRTHVQAMHRSAGDMLQLVNDVLDLARLERGLFTITPKPLALRPWLDDSFLPFAELGRARGLHMQLDADAIWPDAVLADGLRLRQVLNNVLANALKFTQSGAVTLVAGWTTDTPLQARDSATGTLRLAVRDTGRGIAPQVMERLFVEFEQGDETVGPAYGGFGLGLALCRQLLQHMGGSIGVHSHPGQGSTFHIQVPLPVVDTAVQAAH